MKTLFTILISFSFLNSIAQTPCIDPSLIDPFQPCSFIYAPVCGCDGETYSNDCVAQYGFGVTDWTVGECSTGGGCLDLTGLDFGDCEMALGIGFVNGSCQIMSGCGYIVDDVNYSGNFYDTLDDCSDICGDGVECFDLAGVDFGFCDFVLGVGLIDGNCVGISGCDYVVDEVDYTGYFFDDLESCQDNCEEETCVDPDQIDFNIICAAIFDPVCGCDGITYPNECEAINYGGVTSYTSGECGDVIIAEPCTDVANVDFGPCDAELGWAVLDGVCVLISGCEYTVDGVNYINAFYDNEADCIEDCEEAPCIDPSQVDPDFGCFDFYSPVCGCDGVTYGNDCYATYYGGVTSYTFGVCDGVTNAEPCTDVVDIDFGPCELFLGWAVLNGSCSSFSGCSYVVDDLDYTNAFYTDEASCIADCGQPCINLNQIDPDHVCTQDFNPVCGCDNVTYATECDAYFFYGLTDWTDGPCPDPEDCYNEEFDGVEQNCDDVIDLVCGCNNVTYDNACLAFSAGIQTWTPGECTGESIQENALNNYSIFPIPFVDELNIKSTNGENFEFEISDMLGRKVFVSKIIQGTYLLDTSDFVNGTYTISFFQENRMVGAKLLIK